jgi:ABC-type glutathione transport system ATPase component
MRPCWACDGKKCGESSMRSSPSPVWKQFIDTPVKRYSSGMYVRLAFAVAAHLEPEILIVDEVLAVGDASFQQKCLGKMEEVSRSGRTVLIVSHNMTIIEGLCERAILLEKGRSRERSARRTTVVEGYADAIRTLAGTAIEDRAMIGSAWERSCSPGLRCWMGRQASCRCGDYRAGHHHPHALSLRRTERVSKLSREYFRQRSQRTGSVRVVDRYRGPDAL